MKNTITLREARDALPPEDKDIDKEFELARAVLPAERRICFPVSHFKLVSNYQTDKEFLKRLQEVLEVFSLSNLDENFNEAVNAMECLLEEQEDYLDMDVNTLGTQLEYLDNIASRFDQEFRSILDALSTAGDLIAFLTPILKQDITFLVDVVGEFAEYVVTDSALSSLIYSEGIRSKSERIKQ